MYRIIPQNIPQSRRKEINEKILYSLSTSKPLPPETVYNCYTGDGGLHGLKQSDYSSYHDYAQAKKEIENGQFLTPHELCRLLVETLQVNPDESVIEMCCGTGNFLNWLPNQSAVTAFDIDAKAVTVAKYLYPKANITRDDLHRYEAAQRYDVAIGNPPFNLKIGGELSQKVWMERSARSLAPGGLLMALVPASFLADPFADRTAIEDTERLLSFIGQSRLPDNAFRASGVDSYQTKVMVFHRKAESLSERPYDPETTVTLEDLAALIEDYRKEKNSKRLELRRETKVLDEAESEMFEYKVRKYLYEIKTHRTLQKHLSSALALVNKYRNQKPPQNATPEQYKIWEKTRLHAKGVLAVLRRYIREQDRMTRKEVALVRTSYGYKLKAYAPRLLDNTRIRQVSMCDLQTGRAELPRSMDELKPCEQQYRTALEAVGRRIRDYERKCVRIDEHKPDTAHVRYAENATFVNAEGKTCRFTALQRKDLAVILGRDQCLLNWQQGSGKTAAAFHKAKYLTDNRRVKATVILAPAIAVRMTWEPFLTRNGVPFVTLRKGTSLEDVVNGTYVLIPTTMLSRCRHEIRRFVKTRCRKLCLVFDESDELTNPSSQKTRLTLALFRRVRHKILATGTTTRNNITELYSQMELLYNNSAAMTCWCPQKYEKDEEGDVIGVSNDGYGSPYPPRGGYALFRACHCPTKTTVFGIEKMNQDIYNADQLREMIARTVITRKFRDFAGERYAVTNHMVTPTQAESDVYEKVIKEFHNICRTYFRHTGNERKEAGLKLARQIRLLIRACSTPNFMEGYTAEALPTKTGKIGSLVDSCRGKIAIGCTSIEAVQMYSDYLTSAFPDRKVHVVTGEVEFRRRADITAQFNESTDDILICTQQSLSSSVNIPDCDDVILESLQWNIPRMEQFYFRFIRLDSANLKRVHFVTYSDSIEQNLLALVMTKERLNDFIRTGEVQSEDDIFNEFGINPQMLCSFLGKETDDDGRMHLTWGHQKTA